MKRIFVILLSVLFVSGVAFAEKKEVPANIVGAKTVNAEQIIDLIDTHDDLIVIDSRKKSDVAKGFIEGSVSLPNTETNADTLAKHIPSKATHVVFYCNGIKCGRSGKAVAIAHSLGYKNLYWFRGGMQEWENKGLPIAKP